VPLDQHFFYKNGVLHCDSVALSTLAKRFETPLFVTSKAAILENYERFEAAFQPLNHLTCYSVKANYTLEVIRTLIKAGSGLDVNSGGELFRALKAGAPPEKIIMAGVGKTAQEIEYALQSKILMLKAESLSELKLIDSIACKLKCKAPVGIRITPNVTAETHPYITTGNHEQKFGIDEALAEKTLHEAKRLRHLHIVGLEMHIGSQIYDPKYYCDATALYGAYHEILPVRRTTKKMVADVVGPVCETGDFFARERVIAEVKEGDIMALLSAGAYGMVMSSNYNARARAADVMIDQGKAKVIRKRETLEQMIENEL